ncbi:MCE family protein [Gordonia sp. HS-NH1]|uniref:MCE family protein n=1 Tax=Gordonia sp. HS-NH1 TaxID=1435068 RepID=UPI0006E34012|nr:MCE family protein [Gordonia sp. HS-NH1]
MRRTLPRFRASACALIIVTSCGACSFDGVNSWALPGNTATSDTYEVSVQFADVQNLVGNSPVKFENVTVGNIRSLTRDGWSARAVLEIDDNSQIPANVGANLVQTSLFGSQYIELVVPRDQPARGRLRDGMSIPLENTSEYPAVEEVLSSLSLVLNGSGLQQLRTITGQLDRVVNGREDTTRSLVTRLNTFVSGLSDQRRDIQRALDSLAQLSDELENQKQTIAAGIDSIQPALDILNEQEGQLVQMLGSLGQFGDAATGILNRSRDDLLDDISALPPILGQLANSGRNLTEALKIALTIPFPVTTASRGLRGDYMNLFLTLDISADKLAKVVIPSITRTPNKAPTQGISDPLRAPLRIQKDSHR